MFGKKPVLYFDANPDTGGGSSNDGKSGNSGDGKGGNEGEKTVQLTQSALDAMFSDRAKRGAEAAVKSLLEKLGLENEDALTAVVGKAKQVEDSQKTELQKLQDEMTKAQEKAKKAEEEKKAILEQATERLMKASVLAEATSQTFRPDAVNDVWLFVDRKAITEKDGEFTGVKEAVQAIAKAKPWMLAEKSKTPGTPPPQNNSGKKTEGKDGQQEKRPVLRL